MNRRTCQPRCSWALYEGKKFRSSIISPLNIDCNCTNLAIICTTLSDSEFPCSSATVAVSFPIRYILFCMYRSCDVGAKRTTKIAAPVTTYSMIMIDNATHKNSGFTHGHWRTEPHSVTHNMRYTRHWKNIVKISLYTEKIDNVQFITLNIA